jgi:hypothetical protein
MTNHMVSQPRVSDILREIGFDLGSKRDAKARYEFIKMRAASLWHCG